MAAGPHCGVTGSGLGRAAGTCSCPTVGTRVVSAASVQIGVVDAESAPDDHLAAGPDCRVRVSGLGRVGGAGSCPTVGDGVVSPAGVQIMLAADVGKIPAPDNHLTASPDRGLNASGIRGVGGVGWCPTIRAGIISAASVRKADEVS